MDYIIIYKNLIRYKIFVLKLYLQIRVVRGKERKQLVRRRSHRVRAKLKFSQNERGCALEGR